MNKKKLENKILDSVKKKNGGQLPDERQQQFNSTVIAGALIFGIAFDLIMMVYYFITKDLEKSYPYVAQLVLMSVGCLLASLGSKDAAPPTVLFSRRGVNTDRGARALFGRIAWCMLDSLVLAAVLTAFDAYSGGKVTGSLISDGLVCFGVFTFIEIIFCELKVCRYRRYTAMLDAQENDLDD